MGKFNRENRQFVPPSNLPEKPLAGVGRRTVAAYLSKLARKTLKRASVQPAERGDVQRQRQWHGDARRDNDFGRKLPHHNYRSKRGQS